MTAILEFFLPQRPTDSFLIWPILSLDAFRCYCFDFGFLGYGFFLSRLIFHCLHFFQKKNLYFQTLYQRLRYLTAIKEFFLQRRNFDFRFLGYGFFLSWLIFHCKSLSERLHYQVFCSFEIVFINFQDVNCNMIPHWSKSKNRSKSKSKSKSLRR